ncbi:MAG: hypothetical protein GQ570_11865 [Helicobacteraceae bacterium]|nr:hypothetical protein [Helicobacteraceae bacterium]
MKPTYTNMAEFYSITIQTLGNYKRSKKKGFNHRYEALKEYFIKTNTEVSK